MGIKDRDSSDSSFGYRFGFNGIEGEAEVSDCGCDVKTNYTTMHRQYDARLGRWQSVDPAYKYFPSQSPYNNNFNDPINLTDPDGDCPLCGFLFSYGMDYAIQKYEIHKGVRQELDYKSILVSGFAGFVGVGVAAKVHKLYKVSKTVSKVRKIGIAVGAGLADGVIDAGVSAGSQYVKTRSVSGEQVVLDAVVGGAAGRLVGGAAKYAASSSKYGGQLAKQAKDLSRKANNNQKPSRIANADNAVKKLDNFLNATTVSAGAAGSGTGSAIVKEYKEQITSAETQAVQSTTSKDATTSYIYQPERIGNTTFYYLKKDHTQVYNTNDTAISNVVGGKAQYDSKSSIDVSKKILVNPE
tara:strand:+ start:189 stop:1253 length:1065 start_codon:yes stop_codon:yes gene_type:complete